MSCHCKLDITLNIQTPFLCSATGPHTWGVDHTFHRDFRGRPAIQKSHIKGRLREAWKELNRAGGYGVDLDRLLGKTPGADDGEQTLKGCIRFSDFICTENDTSLKERRHRIRIEKTSGTADEGALIAIETPFKSGMATQWKGSMLFHAANTEEAEIMKNQVLTGLRWITAFGAEKTIGFGLLTGVECDDFRASSIKPPAKDASAFQGDTVGLSITVDEPIISGGVKMKDNYLESESVLTGAVLKGSLAQCIRRRLDLPRNTPISSSDKMEKAGLSLLGQYFEKIRFAHAFPAIEKNSRPVKPPLSLVKYGSKTADIALNENPGIDKDQNGSPVSPAFSVDWKSHSDVEKSFGWASLKRLAVTRTAVESNTRTARDEQLYTFEYLCPEDESGNEIVWQSLITLPEKLAPEADKSELAAQLSYVIQNWFDAVGKREGCVKKAELSPSNLSAAIKEETDIIKDDITVITLQTDALMLNPWEIDGVDQKSLKAAYDQYWDNISGGAYRLLRFYARQQLSGGFIGMRYKTDGKYCPFLLTAAGSVFILEPADRAKAEIECRNWKRNGLPLPEWTKSAQKYGNPQNGEADWTTCPFVRENGFGEIAVNLSCHWSTEGINE